MPYDLLVPAAKRRQVNRGQVIFAAVALSLAWVPQAAPAAKRASSADGSLTIEYSWESSAIRVGDFQVLHMHVVKAPGACTRSPMSLLVDGSMPDHGHGLNYHVVVRPGAHPAEFEARGLMFHMQGGWELHVDVQCGSARTRAFIPVSVQ